MPEMNEHGEYATKVMETLIFADANLTQLLTLTTGVTTQGPNVASDGGWMFTANPTNTNYVWFMFHGETKASKGYPLGAGVSMVVRVKNLNSIDFVTDTTGNKLHTLKI